MADEQTAEAQVEESTEQNPENQTEESQVTETQETQKPEKEGTEEAAQTQEEEAQAQTTTDTPRKFKIKVDGQEEEHDESELVELAQKGAKFTKNQQALAEQEKILHDKAQMADQLLNDPTVHRMAMAKRMGIDPSIVLFNPAIPNPNLEAVDPQAYYTQVAQYNLAVNQKLAVDRALGEYVVGAAQTNNNALFAKARIQHDLSDQQTGEVSQFVQNKMRPNQLGMYSDEDIQFAVSALYGKKKEADARLQTADKIRQNIKTGTSTAPAQQTKKKNEEVDPEVAQAHNFLEFVRDRNKGG